MSDVAIEIRRGDTEIIPIRIMREGVDIDLTGAIIWFTVKRNFNDLDSAALFQKRSNAGGIAVLDQTSNKGECNINIDPADTANIALDAKRSPVYYWYDVQVKEPSGRISTVMSGPLVMSLDVSRATT